MICKQCNVKMAKAGRAWSGRDKVQQYLCKNCGVRKLDLTDRIKPNNK